jgi:hypothetical protein
MKYVVQPGDTPMSITQKLLGNPTRVADLVRANAHKGSIWVGPTLTFREMHVGEQLVIPPKWETQVRATARHVAHPGLGAGGCPSGHYRDASGNCVPLRMMHPRHHAHHPQHHAHRRGTRGIEDLDQPSFEVAPRAQGEVHEPILTVSGPGAKKPCCRSCAEGKPCEGGSTINSPCSQPQAPPSIPGSTSFPVGFGQGPITTQYPAVAVVSSWGVPLAIGLVSAAAGFGLAYWIAGKD